MATENSRVYLDNAATTRIDPEVLAAMQPYYTMHFGNASSIHSFGSEAAAGMKTARESVARLIGAQADEVIFTAGGTESDNMALKGAAFSAARKPCHIITSKIEHPAILSTCEHLEDSAGCKITYLPVDRDGIVSIADVERAITPETRIISIMHANNEIGTIEPVTQIGKLASSRGILFHTDAVQSAGKIPIDVRKMSIDLLSISSHKIHGPKGIGALYIRKGIKIGPMIHGGGHEGGMRSGTENVPGIVGLGKACELALARMAEDGARVAALRDRLINGILGGIEQSALNGHRSNRLPNNASFRFAAIEGEALVLGLDKWGIAASTGSACSSKKLEPSHVLRAIGLSEVESHGSLRMTLSRETTDDEISYVLEKLPAVVARLREISPIWKK